MILKLINICVIIFRACLVCSSVSEDTSSGPVVEEEEGSSCSVEAMTHQTGIEREL